MAAQGIGPFICDERLLPIVRAEELFAQGEDLPFVPPFYLPEVFGRDLPDQAGFDTVKLDLLLEKTLCYVSGLLVDSLNQLLP